MGKRIEFTSRFERALLLTYQLHAGQSRKGSHVPYISHLLAVCSLVIEDGGDEDQAIAALLHDAAEDQGGRKTLSLIKRHFGERVAVIVEGCSDTLEYPKPAWKTRKENYLTNLNTASDDILRISLADKLHNARSILFDLTSQGEIIWNWFNGGKEGTLWYYHSLEEIFNRRFTSPMVEEFMETITRIEMLTEQGMK